jgi:hypothetical protein
LAGSEAALAYVMPVAARAAAAAIAAVTTVERVAMSLLLSERRRLKADARLNVQTIAICVISDIPTI